MDREDEGYRKVEYIAQKLLESKEVDNKGTQEIIENMKEFVFKEFIPKVDRMDIFEDEYEMLRKIEKIYEKWENIILKPWLREKCVVSILGGFSSGKSSIVNSILGEDLLPVDVTPTTAIPTYISYGPRKKFKFVDREERQREISEEVFKMLSKATKMRESALLRLLFSYIKYCVMEFPLDVLEDISLLDTPGYNSVDIEDIRKAKEVVKESNVIVWVMDIEDGTLSGDSVKFIKEITERNGQPFYVVVNKVDLKPPGERERVKRNVESVLNKNNIKYEKCILYTTRSSEYKNEMINIIKSAKQKDDSIDLNNYIKEIIDRCYKKIGEYMKEKEEVIKLLMSPEKREIVIVEKIIREIDKEIQEAREILQNLDEMRKKIIFYGG